MSAAVFARRAVALDMVAAVSRHAVSLVAGAVTFPLVGATLGAEALGVWGLLGASTAVLALADLGTSTAVQRAAVRPDADVARAVVRVALRTTLVMTPPLAILAAGMLVLDAGRDEILPSLLLVLAAGGVSALAGPLRGFAIVRGGVRGLARARAAGAGAQVVITLGLLVVPSLVVPAAGLLVGNLVELVLASRVARRCDRGRSPRPATLPATARRQMIRDALAALALHAAVLLGSRVDVFLVARVGALEVVAAYALALRAVEQAFVLAKQTSSALLPRLGEPAHRTEAVRLGTGTLGSLVVAGMLALAIDGPPLLAAWAGGALSADAFGAPLALLALGAVIASLTEVACSGLVLGGRSAWSGAAPLVAGACVNVAIGVGALHAWGVLAVAAATVAGNLVTAVWVWVRARRLLGWTLVELVRALAPAGLAAAAGAPVALALRGLAETGPVASLLACVVTTLVGAAAGGLLTWTARGPR